MRVRSHYTTAASSTSLPASVTHPGRPLALREFGLGIEGLERFTRRGPLRRGYEPLFGVLALENEPVDPRL